MNQLPVSSDTVIGRVFRTSKELADALAAYRLLQARLDEQDRNRQSAASGDARRGRHGAGVVTPRTVVSEHDVKQARAARRAVVAALAARLGVEYRRALGLVAQRHGLTLDLAVQRTEAEYARRRLATRTTAPI